MDALHAGLVPGGTEQKYKQCNRYAQRRDSNRQEIFLQRNELIRKLHRTGAGILCLHFFSYCDVQRQGSAFRCDDGKFRDDFPAFLAVIAQIPVARKT